MNIVLGIVVGLLVLTFLITAHEFGHFLMARRSGVRVKEFGIGFPPRAAAWVRSKPEKGKKKSKWRKIAKKDWKKEQNSLIFSLNWLPIGGFCAMDGESDDETRPGTFGSVNFWKKTKILFGGVMMNWLVAFLILTILCWAGLPEMFDHQFTIKSDEHLSANAEVIVGEVKGNSPAERAGFKEGDRFVSVGVPSEEAKTILTSTDVIDFNEAHPDQTVIYTVRRKTCNIDCYQEPCECPDESYYTLAERKLEVTLNPKDSEYLLGVTMNSPTVNRKYTWSAPIVAAGLTVQTTGETFKGLGKLVVDLVTGAARQVSSDESVRKEGQEQLEDAGNSVSGIVGIIGNYFPNILSAGLNYILLFVAVISISLACMNVLPIPALDGGRWLMIFIARLRHKRLSKEREQAILSKAVIFLLILMVIITILDIIKLF
jgi:regulator of sigma E protease